MPASRRALFGLALILPAVAARAEDDIDCRNGMTRAEAIAMARGAGLVQVRKAECDDDEWEIEGLDAQGRKIEVEIDSRARRIKEIDRD
jgi:hypothetical protein